MTPTSLIFTVIVAASFSFFLWSCYRRLSLISLGSKDEARFDHPGTRLAAMLSYAFGQKRVLSRPFGINHAIIFWSFLTLAAANAEFILHGLHPALSLSLLPTPLAHGLLFAFDIVSLLALIAAMVAAVRRLISPPYAEARTGEAFVILGMIAFLMLAYFGLHGAEIAIGKEEASAFMPISLLFAKALISSPLAESLAAVISVSWWLHALLLLLFLNYLPYSKHLHILTAIPNCFFRSLEQPNSQPREVFKEGEKFGVGRVEDFSWKDLLDSFACTECGRCQQNCPAAATGKELNPRLLIHTIKENLLANAVQQEGGRPKTPLIASHSEKSISEEAIWSCTTCGACMEACPVFIEQMPKLVKLRRFLVQNETNFPEELLNLFENMEGRSNPWGIAPSERSKWIGELEIKPFVASETEYLYFVGCAGAFDSRNKQVSLAVARILNAAGISWGILGKEEKCCGDSLRRLGNEYLFDRMARENVELFRSKGITKVITHCPHCFTTLQNDYRQYGLELEVIHHSAFIDELLRSNRIAPGKVAELGKVVFHDSCYLGRHNDIYTPPRSVIGAMTGAAPSELERNKENSFCCGAGGGRMWLEEQTGTRINRDRVAEALRQSPETICVSCPYCLTMFEDGLKDGENQSVRVRDIAEVVAAGLPG